MEILIYIIGFFVAYIFAKWGRKKMNIKSTWEVVFFTTLVSIFSWVAVVALGFASLIVYCVSRDFPEPPKFL